MSVRQMLDRRPAAGGGGFSPTDIAGLLMWHDASAITGLVDGDPVVTWEDAHTTNVDFTQIDAARRPTYQTAEINSLPVVRFVDTETGAAASATSDNLAYATAMSLKPVTVFTVLRLSSVTDYSSILAPQAPGGFLWRVNNAANAEILQSNVALIGASPFTVSANTPVIIGVTYSSAGAYAFYKNSATPNGTGTNDKVIDSEMLFLGVDAGGVPTYYMNGDIAEQVVYNSVLSAADIESLVAYLATKWGISWAPSDIGGLQQWVRSSDLVLSDNDPVSSWADRSGNGRNFSQATGANQPVYKTNIVNGLPVVRADGVNDILTSAVPMTATDNFTLFAVCATASTNYRAPYMIGDGAANGYGLGGKFEQSQHAFLRGGLAWHPETAPGSFATTAGVYILRRSGGTWKLWRDGGTAKVTVVGSAPTAPATRASLFNHESASPVGCDMVEAGCYSAALTDDQINDLGTYLADRIGTTWSPIA